MEPKEPKGKKGINPKLAEMGISRIPGVEELYSAYDYETPEQGEQKTLDMEWTPELQQQVLKAADEIMSADYFPGKSQFVKISDSLEFKISSFTGTESGKKSFRIDLQNKEKEKQIASFFIEKEKEGEWKLAHRLVMPEYRNQKIGLNMLKLIEGSIQQVADKTNQQQSISIEAGQIGVITFAINHDYLPDQEEDQQKLKQILNGDTANLCVITARGYARDGGDRPGFIYNKETIKEQIAMIGNDNPQLTHLTQNGEIKDWAAVIGEVAYGEPDTYEFLAYNIALRKNIEPRKA